MANPFKKIAKNAKNTKSKSISEAEKKEAKIESRTCEQCGAPRPKNTNLTTCAYCGYEFMIIDAAIQPDN